MQQQELDRARLHEQLKEKDMSMIRMEQQLRMKDGQQQNLQRQFREMEQQLTNCHGQLRQNVEQLTGKDEQLREKDEQLREKDEQLREKDEQLSEMFEQLREKDEQLREKDEQLSEKDEQIRLKDEQLREKEVELTEKDEQLKEKDEEQENLQEQLGEMEQQLIEKEQREENLQRQLREMGQRLTHFEEQSREREEERANLQQQNVVLERQLRDKEEEVNELEISLSTIQRTINEQRRQETCDWVIVRDEIQISEKCIGRGGWGSVYEGMYCGSTIAVKQIHELILSPHNRRLFEREMNIASRCRHPCLLQFIGATNDEGSPLFVTELMETSLRELLQQQQLSETEIAVISLDVAKALNYLHQKKPDPIIHRDVSSANVLLWRQGGQWRAKVSDYGTANFMQNTMTAAPGAMIYSAPEALTSKQTVKVSYIWVDLDGRT